jgi:hypothetical protein
VVHPDRAESLPLITEYAGISVFGPVTVFVDPPDWRIIAPTRARYVLYCQLHGLDQKEFRHIDLHTVKGHRLNPDHVIKLAHMDLHPKFSELRAALIPAGVDIYNLPETPTEQPPWA